MVERKKWKLLKKKLFVLIFMHLLTLFMLYPYRVAKYIESTFLYMNIIKIKTQKCITDALYSVHCVNIPSIFT